MPIQRIQIRRGTTAEWTAANPILASGELGVDTDTDVIKIGDGVTAWDALGPIQAGGGDKMEPTEVTEGRALFMYGPSRGVGVTAKRIHFDRIRERIRSGFFFNGSVGGYLAADTVALMTGARSVTAPRASIDAWLPTTGACTWSEKAMHAGISITWPFGNDARLDGRADRNSTTAKARAGAQNALTAQIALERTEARIASALNGTYSITNGSATVTGLASPWYKGMLVQGTGIPANSYVGDLINGGAGGFKLSSSRTTQVDVNATATNAAVVLTFSPVYTGTWASVAATDSSGGTLVKTNQDGVTSTYVVHLNEERRIWWLTAGIDDAEYVATAGAPFGGTGGAGYSIVVDGGAPIVGTTSNEHRFGQLNNCWGQKVVDLGDLAAGVHTITITSTGGAGKVLVDDGLLVESQTPLTQIVMKEVELPAAYYALNASTGASLAKTVIYNGIIDTVVALWPDALADQSLVVGDVSAHGYDPDLHISGRDGAWAHFNDAGEGVVADYLMGLINALPARPGLVWD